MSGSRINPLKIESDGGIAVNVQDQTTPALDLYFTQPQGAPSTLAASTSIDDLTISVTDNILSDGDYVGVFSGASGEGRFFFAEVLGTPTGTGPYVATLDTPLDFAFEAGDNVISTTRDINVDGSGTTQIFSVQVGGASGDIVVDITRLILTMVLTTQPDDGLFGNIPKLTNGIVLRRVDGDTRNIFNAKDNHELANLAYDVTYEARSIPQGSYGLRWRYTFAGQDKHGVAVRLMAGESLELLVQDDLTTGPNDIISFRMIAAGHIVN